MNQNNLKEVKNPLYRNNKFKKPNKQINLKDVLITNQRFNKLKASGSPHKSNNVKKKFEYNSKPVSKFQDNAKLANMLQNKLGKNPNKKMKITEISRKRSTKKITNQKDLQNMLQNKIQNGQNGLDKMLKHPIKKEMKNRNSWNNNNQAINNNIETKVPEETQRQNKKKTTQDSINFNQTKDQQIFTPDNIKYILSLCCFILLVLLIFIIVLIILYFTTNKETFITNPPTTVYIENVKNFTNSGIEFIPTTTILTSTTLKEVS